jgi:hypothetical protein
MVTQASVNKLNQDPAKKKAFLADLDNLMQAHGIEADQAWKDIVAKPDLAHLDKSASSIVITITA